MKSFICKRFALPLFLLVLAAIRLLGSDWPQFLGPTRNGVYTGPLATNWPKEGPKTLWQKKVGQGFSGPVVAAGKLILFHRVQDKETLDCLEAHTGKTVWTFDYTTAYHDDFGFDEGPRATPAIAEGRVFAFGAEGVLSAVELNTGKKLWSINAKQEFHAPKGFFGIACSPLVESNLVLMDIGGTEAGIAAFDTATGKLAWKSGSDEASYSSPTAATIHGRRYAFVLTRSRLVGLAPGNGRIYFEFPFRPPIRSSVTAATPLVVNDELFVSASYGTGAALLKITDAGAEKVWSGDEMLSNHYATSVFHEGFLYGIHGRTDPGMEPAASLRCIELATGKLRWEQKDFDAATLTVAGDELLILTERGELVRVAASPAGYKALARVQVLPSQVRAHPALADARLYARSKDTLVCLDLRVPEKK